MEVILSGLVCQDVRYVPLIPVSVPLITNHSITCRVEISYYPQRRFMMLHARAATKARQKPRGVTDVRPRHLGDVEEAADDG